MKERFLGEKHASDDNNLIFSQPVKPALRKPTNLLFWLRE